VILAFETASTDLSVAVARHDGSLVGVEGWSSDRRQGHETLPRLLALLDRQGLGLADATGVAVGIGPGSFTGLRVGMSLAKGLALALAVPIVGVPSLEAWLAADREAQAALGRAGAREGYLLLRGEERVRIVDRDGMPEAASDAPMVASGELAAAFGLHRARPPLRAASAVASLAAERLRTGTGDALDRLEPAYIRLPRGVGQLHHVEAS
jgi:tRNA threonylcarbamoyladenosine biosynthesis protein TsaB